MDTIPLGTYAIISERLATSFTQVFLVTLSQRMGSIMGPQVSQVSLLRRSLLIFPIKPPLIVHFRARIEKWFEPAGTIFTIRQRLRTHPSSRPDGKRVARNFWFGIIPWLVCGECLWGLVHPGKTWDSPRNPGLSRVFFTTSKLISPNSIEVIVFEAASYFVVQNSREVLCASLVVQRK